jgi:transcriptional repressor NrdR
VPITVLKRNGDRESFDRSKLLRGIIRACEKVEASGMQMEAIVDEIEAELQQRAIREVPSSEIGELVLQHLRNLSEVAYIRFASVYRKFQGIHDFVETLNHLQNGNSLEMGRGVSNPAETTQAHVEDAAEPNTVLAQPQ